jgi:hypothetical protein
LIILAISFIAVVPFLFHASRRAPPPPPPPPAPEAPANVAPFWCSTWESATPIPEAWWADIYGQYKHWAHYDRSGVPKVVPEQLPAKGSEESENHSSARSPEGQELEVMEENIEKRASKTKWNKPKGIKVIALIFCKRLYIYSFLGHS